MFRFSTTWVNYFSCILSLLVRLFYSFTLSPTHRSHSTLMTTLKCVLWAKRSSSSFATMMATSSSLQSIKSMHSTTSVTPGSLRIVSCWVLTVDNCNCLKWEISRMSFRSAPLSCQTSRAKLAPGTYLARLRESQLHTHTHTHTHILAQ